MKVYADLDRVRIRQVAIDAAFLLWVPLWVYLGIRLKDVIERLQQPAREVRSAGDQFADRFERVSEVADRVPFVGDDLRQPFDEAAGAGRLLEEAGAQGAEAIAAVAFWGGFTLAALPIVLVALVYLPWRIRWVREATAAEQLLRGGADTRLFALRAVSQLPLHQLAEVSGDPWRDLSTGDPGRLAELHLRSLGLHPAGAAVRTKVLRA